MAERLSDEELARLLYQAGFRDPDVIATMVAIAHPESGARPDAYNGNTRTGDQSYGLWQINMLGAMGPQRRKTFGISSNDQLFDPLTNAKAAFAIYQSQGFAAWSAYKAGKHQPFMAAARKAAGAAATSAPPADAGSAVAAPARTDTPDVPEGPVLPTADEVRELFRRLTGQEPTEQEMAIYTGLAIEEGREMLLFTDEALDWHVARGAQALRDAIANRGRR